MRRSFGPVRAAGLAFCSAGLLLVLAPSPRAAADSQPVAAEYEVYAGGIHVLTSVLEVALDERRYDARLGASLVGIPGVFVEWGAEVRSGGVIEGGQLDPSRYQLDRVRRGESQKTVLEFPGNGGIDVTFDPVRTDSTGLVPPDMLADSLDPLSGLISVINTVTEGGGCDATVPVFDGRRRYDLVFDDLGMVSLDPSSLSGYAGPSRRCRMSLVPVAGAFRDDDDDDDDGDGFWSRSPESDRRRQMDIWLAQPIAEGPTLPVRMVGRSSIGAVVIHLRQAQPATSTADATEDCAVPAAC